MGKKYRRWEAFALIRLHFLVEGQTEEGFVNNILSPALQAANVFADAHRITTGRHHGRVFRGGLTDYEQLARDLVLWMKQDQNEESWFTTMVDFYALPNSFPGRLTSPAASTPRDVVAHLESEFANDIRRRLNGLPISQRLIPYIQLHEFESLLFSDLRGFREAFPGKPDFIKKLSAVRKKFDTPEDINNDPLTAPSKKILGLLPDYQKPVAGLLIAERIGLETIRRECPHFDQWLTRLLSLKQPPS